MPSWKLPHRLDPVFSYRALLIGSISAVIYLSSVLGLWFPFFAVLYAPRALGVRTDSTLNVVLLRPDNRQSIVSRREFDLCITSAAKETIPLAVRSTVLRTKTFVIAANKGIFESHLSKFYFLYCAKNKLNKSLLARTIVINRAVMKLSDTRCNGDYYYATKMKNP